MGAIDSRLRAIVQRLRLTVSRGVVKVVNDAFKCQQLQVALLPDEVQDDVERFQDYGITSVPFTGAEALFLSVGANRSHGVVVSVIDRRYRPKGLNEGDVCLYTDKGELVYLERVGDILNLGSKSATDFVALATTVLTRLNAIHTDIDALKTVFSTWVVAPPDGGGALKTAALAWYSAPLGTAASVAATKVKAT